MVHWTSECLFGILGEVGDEMRTDNEILGPNADGDPRPTFLESLPGLESL